MVYLMKPNIISLYDLGMILHLLALSRSSYNLVEMHINEPMSRTNMITINNSIWPKLSPLDLFEHQSWSSPIPIFVVKEPLYMGKKV